jgi:hypothetical protein
MRPRNQSSWKWGSLNAERACPLEPRVYFAAYGAEILPARITLGIPFFYTTLGTIELGAAEIRREKASYFPRHFRKGDFPRDRTLSRRLSPRSQQWRRRVPREMEKRFPNASRAYAQRARSLASIAIHHESERHLEILMPTRWIFVRWLAAREE